MDEGIRRGVEGTGGIALNGSEVEKFGHKERKDPRIESTLNLSDRCVHFGYELMAK